MGGVDLDWVELLAVKHGVEDIEGLIDRLIVIKTHRGADMTEIQRGAP